MVRSMLAFMSAIELSCVWCIRVWRTRWSRCDPRCLISIRLPPIGGVEMIRWTSINDFSQTIRFRVSGFRCQGIKSKALKPGHWNLTPKPLRFGAWNLIFYNTPPLHYSNRVPHQGKTIEAPSGGSPKPGPSPRSGIFDGPRFSIAWWKGELTLDTTTVKVRISHGVSRDNGLI